ncbi:hypothetical protein BBW65_07445 [Helicobacter enhydrae]|uniref:TolC family protein n=1 Tax=Helicobacter enhydrae TaxID=222136 RepID=A0A1B1U7D7_9HELI|nr:TolC family protein [Helicobacter enhydrae]ANV98641.1 hypothetical protein BBW65_07445 [Helicobacter enhydrae]
MNTKALIIPVFLMCCVIDAVGARDVGPRINTQMTAPEFDIQQLLPKKQDDSLGLKDLVSMAQKNLQVLAKNDGIAQAEAEEMSAYLELGPTFVAKYDYNYQTTPSVSGGNYYGGHQANVTANYEIYSGFSTINKIREKKALYRASVAQKKNIEETLRLRIVEQYYAYFTNYSRLVSLTQKKKLLTNNVARLAKLYQSGLTTIDDLESLKAEASLTDYTIAQTQLDLEQNYLNLSLLVNGKIGKLKRDVLKFPNLKTQNERADIVALKEQAESIGYQRSQLSYAPRINLYNTFSYVDVFGNSSMPKPKDKMQNIAGISVQMALDTFGIYKHKEAIGLSQMQALKELAYKKEEQKRDVKLYKRSLEIAQIKVKSAEAGLKSALITFANVSKRYDAQLVTYVDYLNALSQKSNAEATYIDSLNNFELQKANFIFYSGQDLTAYIN